MDDIIRRRIIVSGIVQGVWFRGETKTQAGKAGVSGWVRNLANGDVEAVFEGSLEAVAAMVSWSHRGPDRSTVDEVKVFEEEPLGETGFDIRH